MTPVAAALDLGAPCNNRCAICPREGGEWAATGALEDAIAVARTGLVLHGGEPTLHPQLDRLIALAARAGAPVTVETNARVFASEGRALAARQAGLAGATVTLLGATAAAHDFLAGAAGSFRQTVAGAARLRGAGVALRVRIVITRSSLRELLAATTLALGLGAVALRYSWARSDEAEDPRRWLVPRYSLGLPVLAAAIGALARSGRLALVDGVPRCLLPEGAALAPTGPACFAPSATVDAFSPRCEGCAARPACDGVPPGYLRAFGDGELRPVPPAP